MGCWSAVDYFDATSGWQAVAQGEAFEVLHQGVSQGHTRMPLAGAHNRSNALAALAAAAHVGVSVAQGMAAFDSFSGIRRRLELRGTVRGVEVYDDFAHHPTAIQVTVAALREKGVGRILAVLEPRSNTMRLGSHKDELAHSLDGAEVCFVYAPPTLKWDAAQALAPVGERLRLHGELDALVAAIAAEARTGDRVLVMSNGDFGGIHGRLLNALAA
jgi:UDP-N-acetylmuramate: L-alanyl-gamma-D-glutamyl-meso-diaminopimelate ligase